MQSARLRTQGKGRTWDYIQSHGDAVVSALWAATGTVKALTYERKVKVLRLRHRSDRPPIDEDVANHAAAQSGEHRNEEKAHNVIAALATHGVDLIDEDDAGAVFLRLLEQIAHAGGCARSRQAVRRVLRSSFDYLIVDEYQDCTLQLHSFVLALSVSIHESGTS